ncbi:MAG TPA: response regulator transcription factor [Candidatus Saccharimonadales bacterium]|nr:response regulator transcription factor [Candidatus Saccharimonadales bacterium]
MASLIFVVEDDKNQREFLEEFLGDSGYSVQSAGTGTAAIKAMEKSQPDLVLLDLGLPDVSGESVFQALRKNYPELPVIILTARGTSSDIVAGFDLGADDYVPKPYSADELLSRVKARLKQSQTSSAKLKIADLELETKTFEVRRGGKKIDLTPKEFKLLEYLMLNQGQVLSREMILSRIWMYSPDMESRAVDVYVGYLRKKIDSKFKKKLINSVRGFGYTLKG